MINRVTNFQANNSMNTRSKTSFCSGKSTVIKADKLSADSETLHLNIINFVLLEKLDSLCPKVRKTKNGDVFEFSKNEVIKRTVNKKGNTVLTHIVKKPKEHTTVKTVLINDMPQNTKAGLNFADICKKLDELKSLSKAKSGGVIATAQKVMSNLRKFNQ